jgi:hypothetical protein
MAIASKVTGKKQVRVLRDMLSVVIDRNLELKRQVDETQQKESELLLDDAAVSLVRAIRQTEAAMAEEAGGTSRYAVSELQATLKGFIGKREDGFALRLARTEQKVPPEMLSSITMTFARVPVAFPPAGKPDFRNALEELQAAFSTWNRKDGQRPAQDIVALTTELLSKPEDTWGNEPFVRRAASIATAAGGFALALSRRVAAAEIRAFQASAKYLSDVVRPCLKARNADTQDMARIKEALEGLTGHYSSLMTRE